MNAWLRFAVVPVVFMVLYWSIPTVTSFIPFERSAPVSIAYVKLPTAVMPAPVRLEKINYEAFGMRPKVEVKPKVVVKKIKFNLDSILRSSSGAVAVINGKVVRQGTKLAGGFHVVKIMSRAVELRRGSEKRVLKFPKYIDKERNQRSSRARTPAANKAPAIIPSTAPLIPSSTVEQILKEMKL